METDFERKVEGTDETGWRDNQRAERQESYRGNARPATLIRTGV